MHGWAWDVTLALPQPSVGVPHALLRLPPPALCPLLWLSSLPHPLAPTQPPSSHPYTSLTHHTVLLSMSLNVPKLLRVSESGDSRLDASKNSQVLWQQRDALSLIVITQSQ